jgi:hypothetical protein
LKIHLGSFLLGVAVGAAGATVAKRLRPVGVELLSLGYRLADAARTRVALGREAFEDMVAEARARARGLVEELEAEEAAESVASGDGRTRAA